MKQYLFLMFISTLILTACATPPSDDVEDVLSGKSYKFNAQGFGMENELADFTFADGVVIVGEDEGEGEYTIENDVINIELKREAVKIHLELKTDDFGDGSLIEGKIKTYEVDGQNFDEKRLEEVEEFEGLDFVLEQITEKEAEEKGKALEEEVDGEDE